MMDCEVKEYFSILLEACHVEEISLDVAYRQLRELLERLCRTQMPDGSLQMTDFLHVSVSWLRRPDFPPWNRTVCIPSG